MELSVNRDIFLKSVGHAYGIIEKKTTLPVLSNLLKNTTKLYIYMDLMEIIREKNSAMFQT